MGFGFFKMFAKKKVEDAGQSVTEMLVKFDPETAAEAEIEQLSNAFDDITEKCISARQDWEKEHKEYVEIQELYDSRLSVAQQLEEQLNAAAEEDKPKIETSLTKVLDYLERIAPEVEREKSEADEAKALLDEFEEAVKEMRDKLVSARSVLDQAKRGMEKAQLQEERAKQLEEKQKVLSGIKKGGSKLNTVLSTMEKAAADSSARAEASRMRASMIKGPKVEKLEDDPLVAQALGSTATKGSASDRLAALRKGK